MTYRLIYSVGGVEFTSILHVDSYTQLFRRVKTTLKSLTGLELLSLQLLDFSDEALNTYEGLLEEIGECSGSDDPH